MLEILMALCIMIILVPILSIAFYQLSVLPSENSTQLALNNEVGQLAALLYSDGYMAENFTAGKPPYYGNFSWTSYSENKQYFVSYYYTDNYIARRVTVTNATPTPTPTPTPIPSPVTYTLTTAVVGSGSVSADTSNPHTRGSVVQVSANPAAGWAFSSWSGGLGATSPATITMDSDKTVTATFVNLTNPMTFTSSGTWTVPAGVTSVEVLVVAGGGGGGGKGGVTNYVGGGGGAGGLVYTASYSVTPGAAISVTVGGGGNGGSGENAGTNGGNSVFGTITATGGGAGGCALSTCGTKCAGQSGGSGGGGAARSVTPEEHNGGSASQGYAGGKGHYECCTYTAAGGGGGAGGTGSEGANSKGGNGGNGLSYSISGSSVTYAGGGGGSVKSGTIGYGGNGGGGNGGMNSNGVDGTANTGGGGGGGGGSDSNTRNGGAGGSGIVIVNYTMPSYNLTTGTAGSGTVTTNTSNPHAGGSIVLITANPAADYTFTGWSGDLSGSTNPTNILINSNKTVTANFAPTTYNLTTSVAGSGTVTTNTSNPHANRSVVLITANPAAGYNFTGWSGDLSGSTNPSAILMDSNKAVTATFALTSTQETYTTYLTWHINSSSDFSLLKMPNSNFIVANISVQGESNMGKPINKQLTIYITQRPSAAQNIWGDLPIQAADGLFVSGKYNLISGDVRINGTVKADINSAKANVIDGILTCYDTDPYDLSGLLSYNKVSRNVRGGTLPCIGVAQDYFKTNLSLKANTDGSTAYADEFVFPGDIALSSTGALTTGLYYSPGTITLTGHAIRGNVTFIANRIIINNNGVSSYDDKIYLTPYYGGLLLWANGSSGSMNVPGNGDILIDGDTDPGDDEDGTPCVDLEGVLYAPNGEIELAGSGAKYSNYGTYVIYRAELDKGAILAKYITIAGDYWTIYRW